MLFFICRYYLLKSSIKRSSKDLSDIHKHLLDNRIVTLTSPNKSLEDLLFHMNQTLEVIRTSYQEFEKKEIALKEQIENISHDLRTPLAVIRGYIKLLNKGFIVSPSASRVNDRTTHQIPLVQDIRFNVYVEENNETNVSGKGG